MAIKPQSRAKPARPSHQLSTTARGYGADWQRFRRMILRQHPLCVDCEAQGRTTRAEELHHLVKIKIDQARRLDRDNVLPLCRPCHDKRTAQGE
jgi:5-methylcytosine-specific restriction protein A